MVFSRITRYIKTKFRNRLEKEKISLLKKLNKNNSYQKKNNSTVKLLNYNSFGKNNIDNQINKHYQKAVYDLNIIYGFIIEIKQWKWFKNKEYNNEIIKLINKISNFFIKLTGINEDLDNNDEQNNRFKNINAGVKELTIEKKNTIILLEKISKILKIFNSDKIYECVKLCVQENNEKQKHFENISEDIKTKNIIIVNYLEYIFGINNFEKTNIPKKTISIDTAFKLTNKLKELRTFIEEQKKLTNPTSENPIRNTRAPKKTYKKTYKNVLQLNSKIQNQIDKIYKFKGENRRYENKNKHFKIQHNITTPEEDVEFILKPKFDLIDILKHIEIYIDKKVDVIFSDLKYIEIEKYINYYYYQIVEEYHIFYNNVINNFYFDFNNSLMNNSEMKTYLFENIRDKTYKEIDNKYDKMYRGIKLKEIFRDTYKKGILLKNIINSSEIIYIYVLRNYNDFIINDIFNNKYTPKFIDGNVHKLTSKINNQTVALYNFRYNNELKIKINLKKFYTVNALNKIYKNNVNLIDLHIDDLETLLNSKIDSYLYDIEQERNLTNNFIKELIDKNLRDKFQSIKIDNIYNEPIFDTFQERLSKANYKYNLINYKNTIDAFWCFIIIRYLQIINENILQIKSDKVGQNNYTLIFNETDISEDIFPKELKVLLNKINISEIRLNITHTYNRVPYIGYFHINRIINLDLLNTIGNYLKTNYINSYNVDSNVNDSLIV